MTNQKPVLRSLRRAQSRAQSQAKDELKVELKDKLKDKLKDELWQTERTNEDILISIAWAPVMDELTN